MQENLYERAKIGLHDYIIWLHDRGDKSDQYRCHGHSSKSGVQIRRKEKIKLFKFNNLKQSQSGWFKRKEIEWEQSGRIGMGGYLTTIENIVDDSWTIEKIGTSFPHLNEWDRLAILYIVDGKITESEMSDMKDNIREVVDEIVEMKIARILSQLLQDEKSNAHHAANLKPLNYRKTNKTAGKYNPPDANEPT